MERRSLKSELPHSCCKGKNEEYHIILHIKNQYADSDLRYTVEQEKLQLTTFSDGTRARIVGFCRSRTLEVTTIDDAGKSQVILLELSKDFNIQD